MLIRSAERGKKRCRRRQAPAGPWGGRRDWRRPPACPALGRENKRQAAGACSGGDLRRLAQQAVDQAAGGESGDRGDQPGQALFGQRQVQQPLREVLAQARRLQGIEHAERQGNQHHRGEDARRRMPEADAEAQRHQHDAGRIDRGEHRDRDLDQLGQTEVGNDEGEPCQDDHQAAVGQRQALAEVLGAGAGQADRGDQAGQRDKSRQERAAEAAEGMLHVGVQDCRAVAGVGGDGMAAGAEPEQADVDQHQADAGDQPGDDGVAGDQPRRLHAAGTDGVDDDDAEDQRGEGVHGQVAVDETLGERGLGVLRLGRADRAGGPEEGGDAENRQGKDLQRGEEASDGVQQATGVEGDGQGEEEVRQAVDEQRRAALAEQRHHADLEGHRGGARNGEQRADRQVADRRQQAAGIPADRMAEGVDRTADLGQGDHGDHRQPHRGDQEAQRRQPHMGAGLQADDGREDDVAGPDEQGKGHKTKRQDVPAFQSVHAGEVPRCSRKFTEGFPGG